MPTIEGAIYEIVAAVRAVPGVNSAPDWPVEQITIRPVAMTYVTDGTAVNEPANTQKDLHSITIVLMMPMSDMVQAMKTMLPLYEPVTKAIFKHRNGRTSDHYSTFSNITYALGPIDWPGVSDTRIFGYSFTIEGVKIQNDIS